VKTVDNDTGALIRVCERLLRCYTWRDDLTRLEREAITNAENVLRRFGIEAKS